MTSLQASEIAPAEPTSLTASVPLFVYLMADEDTLPLADGLPDGVRFMAAGAVPAAMVSDSATLLAQAAAMWRGAAARKARQAVTTTQAETRMDYAWPMAAAHVVDCSVTAKREVAHTANSAAALETIRIDLAVGDPLRLVSALVAASGLPSCAFVVNGVVYSEAPQPDAPQQEGHAAESSSRDAEMAGSNAIREHLGNMAAGVAALTCLLATGRLIALQGWIFNVDPDAEIDARDGVDADRPYAAMRMSASLDAQAHIDTLQGIISRRHDAVVTPSSASPSDAHPVYDIAQTRIEVDDPFALMPRAAKTFARESFLDELSEQHGRDPIAFRLAHLDALHDAGARELIGTLADRAAWQGHRDKQGRDVLDGDRFPPGDRNANKPAKSFAQGRGFAFDTVGTPAAYSAWIVDIEVNKRSGEIDVRRVVAGQASGQPGARIDGLPADQIAASVAALIRPASAMSAKLTLNAQASADDTVDDRGRALSYDMGARALVTRRGEVSVGTASAEMAADGVGIGMPSADFMAPAAAAIANALFDATGIRFRAPPFTPERVRNALAAQSGALGVTAQVVAGDVPFIKRKSQNGPPDERQKGKRRSMSARSWLAMAGLGGVIGLAATVWPTRVPIEKIARPDLSTYSAETIARGRLIANTGDCAVCHTAAGGAVNAGGLGLDTPFGKVYSTNLTPDVETGIGGWSYAAFARAMREGISRDGRHLYPAFPYTAFAKISEADMTALYAYLMSQPAVASKPPETTLPFPFNQRYLMAGWNALYLKQGAYVPDTKRSAEWNRGAYLVEGLGHCSACHSPRNALGAERAGPAYMSGGRVDGWIAPSLTAGSRAPVQWTEAALYQYLSTGFSPEHGVAAGPMAPVVSGLATLPATDVRAIANYIASLNPVPVKGEANDLRQGDVVGIEQTLASASIGAAHSPNGQTSGVHLSDVAVAPQAVESPVRAAALDGDALKQGLDSGKHIFDAACAVCHAATGGVGNFGVRPLMSLNTSVSESTPDNLLRIIQDGIDEPATDALGYMPGFKDALDDQQIADLTHYIRARFAPGQSAWTDVAARSAAVRSGAH